MLICSNALIFKIFFQFISSAASNGENMPYRFSVRINIWKDNGFIVYPVKIFLRCGSSVSIYFVKRRKFCSEECCLYLIKTAVVALVDVMILVVRSIITKRTNFIS